MKTSSSRPILLQVNQLCKSANRYSCQYFYYSIELLNRSDKFISLTQQARKRNNFLNTAKKS